MPNRDPQSTGSDRHSFVPTNAGPPQQRSFRGVIRERHEEEGEQLTAALMKDLDSTGLSDEEIAERTPVGAAQLSRIRSGQAHAPAALIIWAIDNSRIRPPAYATAICGVAEGEFRPKPPPSVEERHAAYLAELHAMGIDAVVRDRVAKRLGVTP
jgi:transcriptional regulator with XRE-family HTH domain